MAGDVLSGMDLLDLFPLRDVCRYFRRPNGRSVSLKTVYRWTGTGVRGVQLRSLRVGGQVCTTETWIREFLEAMNVNPIATNREVPPPARDPDRRSRAEDELDAEGF